MNLLLLFAYICCLAHILPLLFSWLYPLYYVPFIVLIIYRSQLNQALWWSLGCGLMLDLFSSQTRLGFYAANYCLTTFCLYHYKTHFFEDRRSTLPVMSFSYACVSNMLQGIMLLAIGQAPRLSWEWVQMEVIMMPLQTSIYAVAAFTFPQLIIAHMKKRYRLGSR